MNENEKNTIDYRFTAVPTNLMMILDNNCKSMLFTLIQLSTYYSASDGYFYRSNELLQQQSGMSKNLVLATVDTLYRHGLVDVLSAGEGKGKHTNKIKVIYERFKDFESIAIDAILNDPTVRINTIDYKNHFRPSYLKGNEEGNQLGKRKGKKVNTNIDNINNIENKEIIYNNIYRKEYNIKNNIRENEEGYINASTALDSVEANDSNKISIDVEENKSQTSTASDSVEVDVVEQYNQFNRDYQTLLNRFKQYTSKEEVESMTDLFADWLQSKYDYFKPLGLFSDGRAEQIIKELQETKDNAIEFLNTPRPTASEDFDLSDWI